MEVICRVAELKLQIKQPKRQGKTVGFVPTMGFLHEGHLSLLRQAKTAQDIVVASIFVNPLQFGPDEDYAAYPRELPRDSRLAAGAGVDILFVPSVEELYPDGFRRILTSVEVREVSDVLCGASRPGHFRGVATVVAKLFNIVEPDTAYFGQKDAQQVVVIKQMVQDLNMNVQIVTLPIVREADGLAMSSRNTYLNPAERQAALVLSKALQMAEIKLRCGDRNARRIVESMHDLIASEPAARVDYIAICDPASLAEMPVVDRPALVAVAARIGNTRLIDNFLWEG
jgi:pantoate--beta-alanine ligase